MSFTHARDWRDDLGVKSTGWFSRRLVFNSQHSYGSSQLSVTTVPGGSNNHFWPLWAPDMHIHSHIYRQNTHAHKIMHIMELVYALFYNFLPGL